MNKIIAAVIGCGRMGAYTSNSVKLFAPDCWLPLSHVEAMKSDNRVVLSSICDVNKETLKDLNSRYPGMTTYQDYKKLLDREKIDLLCIATRTTERYEIITKAISNGIKKIHIEKPLCNSLSELNQLMSIVEENHVRLTYGTIRRYMEVYKEAKRIVDSGEIGELKEVQVNFGEGALFWTHPHSVDLILYFTGEKKLESVSANLGNVDYGDQKNLIVSDPIIKSASLFFENEVIGRITQTAGMDVIISCSKGCVKIEADGAKLKVSYIDEKSGYYKKMLKEIVIKINSPQGTANIIDILLSEESKGYKALDYQHIFKGQRVLFGFVESHNNQGKLVEYSKIGRHSDIEVKGVTGGKFA